MLMLIGETDSIDLSKIVRLEMHNGLYTEVHFDNGTKATVDMKIKDLTILINNHKGIYDV